jgi:CRISPR/Cas system CMR subunit Cmr6 (Cas7 group RAMP superfamily)
MDAADLNEHFKSVKVKGQIPHDSAPNPVAMFLVAIW